MTPIDGRLPPIPSLQRWTTLAVDSPLQRLENDQSGVLWWCPLCTTLEPGTRGGGWMVDVVWTELDGPPITYLTLMWLVEEAMIDHFATHTPAVIDGSL